jgi:hypothetical protein
VEKNEFRALSSVKLFLKLDWPKTDNKLMSKIDFEENFEIYLFTYDNMDLGPSKLNEFLSFLKFHKVSLPFKFSFVSKEASLIPEMTLSENILIDFSPNSLTESKEVQFQEFLKDPKHRALEELYHTIALPHELPGQSDAQMKKVCSLIKSLLYEGQFVFFEEPEIDLGPETLKLFTAALREHAKNRQMNIFIYSKDLPLWTPQSHKMVERKKDFSFQVSPVSRNFIWKEERASFYANPKTAEENNRLSFIRPIGKKRSNNAA